MIRFANRYVSLVNTLLRILYRKEKNMISYFDMEATAKEHPIYTLELLKENIETEIKLTNNSSMLIINQHYIALADAIRESQKFLRREESNFDKASNLHKEIIWSFILDSYHKHMNVCDSHDEVEFPELCVRRKLSAEAMMAAAKALGFRTKEEIKINESLGYIAVVISAFAVR